MAATAPSTGYATLAVLRKRVSRSKDAERRDKERAQLGRDTPFWRNGWKNLRNAGDAAKTAPLACEGKAA